MYCKNKIECEKQGIETFNSEDAENCPVFSDLIKDVIDVPLVDPKSKPPLPTLTEKESIVKDKTREYIVDCLDSQLNKLKALRGAENDTLAVNKLKSELTYLLALEKLSEMPEESKESRAGLIQQMNKSIEINNELDGVGKYGVGGNQYKRYIEMMGFIGDEKALIKPKTMYLPENKKDKE